MEKKTELKTLKDISYWMKEPPHNSDDTKIVFEKELRQEAIKWIKSYRTGNNDETNFHFNEIWWIKHFFNITEEELK